MTETRFQFGTKAETLAALSGKLRAATLPRQVFFSISNWRESPSELLENVAQELDATRLIVRSSCRGEDTAHASMAGAFDSVANVSGEDRDALANAIEQVAESYGARANDHEDQVLIQPMVTEVALSGVAMSRSQSP